MKTRNEILRSLPGSIVDAFGAVSLKQNGVSVTVFCTQRRKGARYVPSHASVTATMEVDAANRLIAAMSVAKSVHVATGLTVLFGAARSRMAGEVRDGRVQNRARCTTPLPLP